MAAAVVPSRARARAPRPPQEPSPSPSPRPEPFHVRLTLHIDRVRGPALPPAPTPLVFRWQRGPKPSKLSKPCTPAPDGAFSAKLALYVTVRRLGPAFLPDDPAVPLDSVLQLLLPSAPEPLAEARFDIPGALQTLVQAGSKSMPVQLALSPAVDVDVTLSFNTIGGSTLAPYVDPARPASPVARPALVPTDPGEAAAAVELERLRADVREKEGRINRLADSTEQLDRAVQDHSRLVENAVPAGDVAALHVRISALEDQKLTVEREKTEAERKVAAHVAHAAKIKATYNQLAAWYNNLRKEHAELQEKHPASAAEQSSASRDLPQDVSTTHEADFKSLERERDELQLLLDRERSEKKEMYSRNSELLESKARTLAELREQWGAAQTTLSSTQKSKDEQAKLLAELQETVTQLRAQVTEKDASISERAIALTSASSAMQAAEARHEEATRLAVSAAVEESKAAAAVEMEQLKQQHDEDSIRQRQEAKRVQETAMREELARVQTEHEAELERVKKSVEELQAQDFEEKLAGIQKEHEVAIKAKEEASRSAALEAENITTAVEDKMKATEEAKLDLEKKVEALTTKTMAQESEKVDILNSVKEKHSKELAELQRSRETVEAEVSELRKALALEKDTVSEYKEMEKDRSALESELESTRGKLAALQKANAETQNSPRDVAATESATDEVISKFEDEVANLRYRLKAEGDKRNQVANLLAAADEEHDELRAMVTRLRGERDEAVQLLKNAKDVVPSPEVNMAAFPRSAVGGVNRVESGESGNLREERDKAIQEVFRVRKGMNKEIKRLKKEKEELNQQLSSTGQSQSSAAAARGLGDNEEQASRIFDLQKEIANEKAVVELLRTEFDELKVSARAKEEAMAKEIAQLETAVEQQVTSSRDLSNRLQKNEAARTEVQERLQSENLEKDKEASRAEALMQKLKSRNASLTVKLASEKNQREEAQSRLAGAETKLANLTSELLELQETGESSLNIVKKLTAEKEQAVVALAETRKRLEMSESRVAERQTELAEAKEKLSKVESSREFLQKEASAAGGKNEAVTEEVTALRSELKQTQSELHKALGNLQVEVEKGSLLMDRENASITELERKNEALLTERSTLQSKYERTEDEYRVLKESYETLEAALQRVREKSVKLQRAMAEKGEECARLQTLVSKMRATNEQLNARFETVRGEHQRSEQKLATMDQEINALREEKASISDKMQGLEHELDDIHARFALMQQENEDIMSKEKVIAEREAKKMADLRKELQSARTVADTLEVEIVELQSNYSKLNNEKASMQEDGDDREAELTRDLINTRVELAYAQEEAVRLRNKLKKLAQNGQGSSSFEL